MAARLTSTGRLTALMFAAAAYLSTPGTAPRARVHVERRRRRLKSDASDVSPRHNPSSSVSASPRMTSTRLHQFHNARTTNRRRGAKPVTRCRLRREYFRHGSRAVKSADSADLPPVGPTWIIDCTRRVRPDCVPAYWKLTTAALAARCN